MRYIWHKRDSSRSLAIFSLEKKNIEYATWVCKPFSMTTTLPFLQFLWDLPRGASRDQEPGHNFLIFCNTRSCSLVYWRGCFLSAYCSGSTLVVQHTQEFPDSNEILEIHKKGKIKVLCNTSNPSDLTYYILFRDKCRVLDFLPTLSFSPIEMTE